MKERLTILQGDCLEILRGMPEASVQCCVTSPPYWGLRDYGVEGQIGLENSFDAFLAKLVAVFNEVRRVLKPDGTCWVNMGDSYCGNPGGGQGAGGQMVGRSVAAARDAAAVLKRRVRAGKDCDPKRRAPVNGQPYRHGTPNLKPKDLVGQPWRLAFALQAAGWYLRSDIIWHKPNPMPESVADRPTKSHEYLFLLTKSARYHYDAQAILEPASPNTHARVSQNVAEQIGSARAVGKTNGKMKAVVRGGINPKASKNEFGSRACETFSGAVCLPVLHRNKRTVWTVPTAGTSDAHFATFPPDLIKPCILAGSRPGDLVLDPFGGSGTTGQVALELGRHAVLCELNPKYIELIRRRTNVTPGLPLTTDH